MSVACRTPSVDSRPGRPGWVVCPARAPGESPEPAPTGPPRRWWQFAPLLLLAGYLLFAHGCHGDEDNELFAAVRSFLNR